MNRTPWMSSLSEEQLNELGELELSDHSAYLKRRKNYYARQWVLKNPDSVMATVLKSKERRHSRPDIRAMAVKRAAKWKRENRDRVKASFHKNKHKHAAQTKERSRQYYLKNKASMIPKQVAYNKQRLKRDHAFKMETQVRQRFRELLIGRRKGRRAMDVLGCTREDFKRYMELLWLPGMSWENYGLYGWHIEHKRPCCTFDLTDDRQVNICFHYTNLQPLWAKDNLEKQRKFFPVESVVDSMP